MLVMVRVRMSPIPVMGLLFLAGLRVFVGFLMIVSQIYSPKVVLVIIPVVVVLVARVINSDLNPVVIRPGSGQNCHRRREGSCQD